MAEKNILNSAPNELRHEFARVFVVEVARRTQNTLFQGVGIRPFDQALIIVVRFEQDGVASEQAPANARRHVAKVGR